ncbi:MAG TPA: o-succinylbenzoate--CoA ligase [Sporichthyaceae bacterium]|nr:o-succinylbenzoate--CoA ligase [Sporichthyaceae bacterium]
MDTRDLLPVVVDASAADPVPGLHAALTGAGPALLPVPADAHGEAMAAQLMSSCGGVVPADTAVVVPTSGSTGEPKGVRIGAAALEYSATATHAALGGPGQWLLAMSPARIAGLTVLVRARAAGVAPVALNSLGGFRADAFADALAAMDPAVRRYTALVPTQLIRLLDAGVALGGLDAILLGGGPIPVGLPERAAAAGVRVVRTYGMTETCGGCVYDGLPLRGVRMMIGVGGLIRITGPLLARGYLSADPQSGFNGAWFTSSDLGHIDGAGVLHVHGRADDVVISGGVNVAAQAVEAVLAGDPAVTEAVVVGRADPEWGQRVVAVLTVTGQGPDTTALRAAVTARLGAPHAPREFVVLDTLPRLPSGKVDRAALRTLVRGAES